MGRKCSICASSMVHKVNKDLIAGVTLSEVSRRYSLPLGTIHRHRSKCIGAPSSTQIAAASTKLAVLQATLPTRDELGSMYGGLRDQLAAIVDDARAKGQLLVSVNAIDAVRKNLDSTAKLAGYDRPTDTNIQVNVNTGPTITVVVDRLLAVVDDAETKEKLATTLLEFDGVLASARTAPPRWRSQHGSGSCQRRILQMSASIRPRSPGWAPVTSARPS